MGCDGKNDEAACSGGTATCLSKATCEVCHNEYGAVDPDNHLYNAGYDISDAEYDYKKCECGHVSTDKATAFKKTVNKLNQQLDMTAESVAIDLAGASDYATVKSVTLVGETVSLGTDLTALDFGDVKADPKKHGEKTVKVVVTGSDGYDHEITVTVILVTKKITTDAELQEVLYCGKTDSDRYGYFTLEREYPPVVISTEVRTKSERSGEIPDNRSITLQLLYFSSAGDLSATRYRAPVEMTARSEDFIQVSLPGDCHASAYAYARNDKKGCCSIVSKKNSRCGYYLLT